MKTGVLQAGVLVKVTDEAGHVAYVHRGSGFMLHHGEVALVLRVTTEGTVTVLTCLTRHGVSDFYMPIQRHLQRVEVVDVNKG